MDPAQQAFQEFMLRGKGASTPPPVTPKKQGRGSSSKKKKKAVGPIFKAFQGRLADWNDVDDQLYAILNSINFWIFNVR